MTKEKIKIRRNGRALSLSTMVWPFKKKKNNCVILHSIIKSVCLQELQRERFVRLLRNLPDEFDTRMPEYNFFKKPKKNDKNVRSGDDRISLQEIISRISEGRFIEKWVNKHHEIYSCPIKGIFSENLWFNIFNQDLGLGEEVDGKLLGWHPESHKIGADLIVPSLVCPRISGKAGKISKIGRGKPKASIREDHRVTYSSHRLTTHLNWDEIKAFLSINHCDVTFLLSPRPKYGKYQWIVLENLDFNKLEWSDRYSDKNNHVGWLGTGGDEGVINCRISRKLSSQLWVELKLSSKRIVHMEEICVY